jgi:hypothetical protein
MENSREGGVSGSSNEDDDAKLPNGDKFERQ